MKKQHTRAFIDAQQALRTLIEAAPPAETTDIPVGGPQQPKTQQKQSNQITRGSALAQSYQAERWSRLRVYRDGQLWDITPVVSGGQLQGFKFQQLKMVPAYDPLQPKSEQELRQLEKSFNLDRDVAGNNVTVMK